MFRLQEESLWDFPVKLYRICNSQRTHWLKQLHRSSTCYIHARSYLLNCIFSWLSKLWRVSCSFILFYSVPCFIYSEASEATVTRVCEASCVQEMLVFSVRLKDPCDFAPWVATSFGISLANVPHHVFVLWISEKVRQTADPARLAHLNQIPSHHQNHQTAQPQWSRLRKLRTSDDRAGDRIRWMDFRCSVRTLVRDWLLRC